MKRSIIALVALLLLSLGHLVAQTCQTTNIAAGKTVTVSTLPGEASYITDGDFTTQWQPQVNGAQWLYIDLGQNYTLCHVVLVWTAWHSVDTFTVQFSADTTSWTTVASNTAVPVAGPSGTNYQTTTIDLSSSTMSGRYVRINFPNIVAWDGQLEEIQVYNQLPVNLPVVSLTAPADGANYTEGDSVVFQATATETGGTISQVQFYQGTTLIGVSTSSPYKYTWKLVPEGEYVVTAKAIDANGNSTASTAINVYVDYPDPAWSLAGNKGSNGDSSFVGTTDSMKLVLRTNNLKRMTILPGGNIGIGVDSPTAQLHTTGTVRFSNYKNDSLGSSVLTTDTAGNVIKKSFSSFGSVGHWTLSGTTTYDSLDNIGIGVSNTQGYKLAVNGSAIFTKVKVKTQSTWPDYVFKRDYKLPDLTEVERFIHQHKHLPGIISADEVSKGDGVDIGENQASLLKKVEELTLYLIEEHKKQQQQDKQIEALKNQNQQLGDQNKQLQEQNARLQNQQQQIDELKKLIQAKNK